ncbi:MAG: hypothetical protein AB8F94_16545 [Saprospiraceae bacterium]
MTNKIQTIKWANSLIIILLLPFYSCTPKGNNTIKPKKEHHPKIIHQIDKRIAAKQNHLAYNQGAYCITGSNFVSKNIILPEIKDSSFNQYIVPLLYRIKEDGTIYDIAIQKNFVNRNIAYRLTTDSEFEMEAIRLLKTSGKWKPFSYHDAYVNREGKISVRFDYHPEYFKSSKNHFTLNPDTPPTFDGDQNIYDKIMDPRNGADGIVTFLAIIEKDGTMSNEHCLQAVGKTNCEIGLSYLRKLKPWKPAIKNGKKIRTQFKITVQTQ